MNHSNFRQKTSQSCLALLFSLVTGIGLFQASAATIWNGPTTTFTKTNFADATLATNQDRMTANVWLTRDGSKGLYNAKTETNYTHLSSPQDTEWAYGLLSDYSTLSYTSWEGMFGGNGGGGPPSTLNKDVVLHLKTDDVYLSVKFTAWTLGSLSGAGFSYDRSTPGSVQPPPPSPKLITPVVLGNGQVRFSFTNTPGYVFTILGSTNVALALSNWTVLGSVTDSPAGFYRFTDATAPANVHRFYAVRWP